MNTMQVAIIAEDIAARLFEAEAGVDDAITKVAAFIAAMPAARQEARLSAGFGHAALEHAVDSLSGLLPVRRAMLKAHGVLEGSQRRAGLAPVNFGGWVDKPCKHEALAENVPVCAQRSTVAAAA